jgi:hypothetical protein
MDCYYVAEERIGRPHLYNPGASQPLFWFGPRTARIKVTSRNIKNKIIV